MWFSKSTSNLKNLLYAQFPVLENITKSAVLGSRTICFKHFFIIFWIFHPEESEEKFQKTLILAFATTRKNIIYCAVFPFFKTLSMGWFLTWIICTHRNEGQGGTQGYIRYPKSCIAFMYRNALVYTVKQFPNIR